MSMQRVGGLGVDFHSGTLFLALPPADLCVLLEGKTRVLSSLYGV